MKDFIYFVIVNNKCFKIYQIIIIDKQKDMKFLNFFFCVLKWVFFKIGN